ncbi:polyubiquitin-like [Bidens hawaiensis]|uniref:polyubiquitin-like n=1 Tax=Bidens hawaiensis TaxID=980011 RepID=UPI00404905FD
MADGGSRKRKHHTDVQDYFEADEIYDGVIKGNHSYDHIVINTPFDEQELIFDNKVLENINTLADLHIKKQSTLTLMRKSVERMVIFVNTITRKTIPLPVDPTCTIAKVKSEIMCRERINVDEQVLIFDEMVLGDTATLFDFQINRHSIITLMRRSKGFMKIFVKTLDEKSITLELEVKPSYNIDNIKTTIEDKLHIPYDEQELIFNEMVLDKPRSTLSDFHINNESTLTVMRKPSEVMQIFITTLIGKTIALEVQRSNTIGFIKSKIKVNHEEEMIFNEMVLDNLSNLADYYIKKNEMVLDKPRSTLSDFHINNESTLTVMRKPSEVMQIFITTLIGKTIALEVQRSNTIGFIKSKIKVNHEEEMIFNEMVLDNLSNLADYYIKKDSTLTLMRISTGFMHISIKTLTGKTITLEVKPSYTIHHVKSMIHEKEHIPHASRD